MAQKYASKKTRSLREETSQATLDLPRGHRKFLLALLEAAICEGVPFYVGKVYRDGKLQYKLFTDREVLETFICVSDDPATEIRAVAEVVFDSKLAGEICEQGARLEAQERLRGTEPAVGASRIVRAANGA